MTARPGRPADEARTESGLEEALADEALDRIEGYGPYSGWSPGTVGQLPPAPVREKR